MIAAKRENPVADEEADAAAPESRFDVVDDGVVVVDRVWVWLRRVSKYMSSSFDVG